MRKILLGAAAMLAVAAPGVASADSGDIGFQFGNTEFDSGGDFDDMRLDGAFSHTLDSGMILQLDGAHDRVDFGVDIGQSYGAVNIGTRNEGHSLYAWAGLGDFFAISTTGLGVGGQLYLGQATINGSVGYTDLGDADFSIVNAHIDGTYFFNDNFGIGAMAGHAESDDLDADWNTLGVNGVWRFTGSGFALSGGYRTTDFEGDEVDTWRLRLSYTFGVDSELERSRSGASFNGAREAYENMLILGP
jgi:hypothetical protein